MESWVLGVIIGIMICLLFAVIVRLEMCHRSLIHGLERSRNELVTAIRSKSSLDVADSAIDMIRDEIGTAINEVAGNMRVPTAIDHLAGVASQIMMMREQWKIQKESAELGTNPLISQSPPSE